MKLRKEYEKLLHDLREDADEILGEYNINYRIYTSLVKTDMDKNYQGVSFTLSGDKVYYDISTLSHKGSIFIKKIKPETDLGIIQEGYPMPDDIRKIINDYGKCWLDEFNLKYK